MEKEKLVESLKQYLEREVALAETKEIAKRLAPLLSNSKPVFSESLKPLPPKKFSDPTIYIFLACGVITLTLSNMFQRTFQLLYVFLFVVSGLFVISMSVAIRAQGKTRKTNEEAYQKQLEEYNHALNLFEETTNEKQLDNQKIASTETTAFMTEVINLKSDFQKQEYVFKSLDKISKEFSIEIAQEESLLKDSYNANIVFEKYRFLPCIASFCEYLTSGRCETLEGVNGAYNLYESELRANLINDKVEEALLHLDDIKKYQYTLYVYLTRMLKSANEVIEKVSMAISQKNISEIENILLKGTKEQSINSN